MSDDAMRKHARAKHVEWTGHLSLAVQAVERAQRMVDYWAGQVRELGGDADAE